MDEVGKKQQYDGGRVKILRLKELMGQMLDQIEGVGINLSEIQEALEPSVGLSELAVLALTETKDWTSRI
jgi:hypothetical protein